MSTIVNPSAANVRIEFPSGEVKTVNMIRLFVQAQNAEFKRDHGMFLPGVNKLRPTVKALRDEYELTARTWEEAAFQLRALHTAISEALA